MVNSPFVAEAVICGTVVSLTVTVAVQVLWLVAPSLTVKVTTCTPSPRLVPAAGLWVMVSGPHASVAVICERRSGNATVQLAPALNERFVAQAVINGAVVSITVTSAVQVVVFVAPSLTVKVTTCTPSPRLVPAAGLCVMVSGPHASVAVIC